MMDWIADLNSKVNSFVWGPAMLALFMSTGLWFSIRTGFFQITRFGLWMRHTLWAMLRHKNVRKTRDEKSISQFQALSTALAGTIGTGNIAGVATALVSGGPGAIFWMWVSALLGMMTSYAEKVLGIQYRYKNEKGFWIGGPMVYIERGLNNRWLAQIFALFCILASFGIGNMTQANSVSAAIHAIADVPTVAIGVVLAILAAMVILGGVKRIAGVAEKLVPFMALFYIFGGLLLLAINWERIPGAFQQIFSQAFSMQAVGGGAAGYVVMRAMRYGIARGVFSNEAGLGSSVMVHSASDVKEPAVQGMWGIFEVFVDTMVVCTITALCILCTGVLGSGKDGVALAMEAFGVSFGPFGAVFISISIALFAFCTILGWSYYGERAVEYLFGLQYLKVYQVIYILFIIVGCVSHLQLVWDISDTFNGLMALPNLIGVIFLSPKVFELTRSYLSRMQTGRDMQ